MRKSDTLYAEITGNTYAVLDTMGDHVEVVPNTRFLVIAQDDITGMVILKDVTIVQEQYVLANHLDLTYHDTRCTQCRTSVVVL